MSWWNKRVCKTTNLQGTTTFTLHAARQPALMWIFIGVGRILRCCWSGASWLTSCPDVYQRAQCSVLNADWPSGTDLLTLLPACEGRLSSSDLEAAWIQKVSRRPKQLNLVVLLLVLSTVHNTRTYKTSSLICEMTLLYHFNFLSDICSSSMSLAEPLSIKSHLLFFIQTRQEINSLGLQTNPFHSLPDSFAQSSIGPSSSLVHTFPSAWCLKASNSGTDCDGVGLKSGTIGDLMSSAYQKHLLIELVVLLSLFWILRSISNSWEFKSESGTEINTIGYIYNGNGERWIRQRADEQKVDGLPRSNFGI